MGMERIRGLLTVTIDAYQASIDSIDMLMTRATVITDAARDEAPEKSNPSPPARGLLGLVLASPMSQAHEHAQRSTPTMLSTTIMH